MVWKTYISDDHISELVMINWQVISLFFILGLFSNAINFLKFKP